MKEYYKIGEISNLYNIGTDSLRYYEEMGILHPKRDDNGYRMYSINDIRKLNIIRELRSIGFSINEIKAHLADFNLQKTKELFIKAIDTIDEKICQLEQLRNQLAERVEDIDYHVNSKINFEIPQICAFPERNILKLSESVQRDDDLDFIIKKIAI